MKFTALLFVLLVPGFALAQQKNSTQKTLDSLLGPNVYWKQPPKKNRYQEIIDSLDMEFGWDDIYKQVGFGPCYCPTPEQVQNMPRENSPYKWDKKKTIIYLDSADLKYFKDKLFFIDSTQLKKKKPVSL